MKPRGIRNNNPGNLVSTNEPWQGQDGADGRFCIFDSPESGIRAMARVLIAYQKKHNLRTVGDMIHRYAPPHENKTDCYAESVAAALGVEVDAAIDVTKYETMLPMVERMITIENGQQPYEKSVLDAGLKLAGVTVPDAPAKPLTQSRIMQGAAVAGVGTIVAWVLENPEAVATVAGLINPSLALAVPKLLTVLGIAYSAYARWDDHRSGKR